MCKDCEGLKAENQKLRDTLSRLRQMVRDMGGGKVDISEDPYEDEAPLIVYEVDDE